MVRGIHAKLFRTSLGEVTEYFDGLDWNPDYDDGIPRDGPLALIDFRHHYRQMASFNMLDHKRVLIPCKGQHVLW